MKLILGGHWRPAPEGWTEVKESGQDITRHLKWADGSVDAIFTEHVIEHVSFSGALHFMREAFRVLRPGGIFRCVAPMVDVFTNPFKWTPELLRRYATEQMGPYYQTEVAELAKLGLDISTDIRPWLVDFLVRKHGHQFCWSSELMQDALLRIGFSAAEVVSPGKSFLDSSRGTCLERRIRGTNGEIAERDFGLDLVFDPESGVVEAMR